MTKEQEALNNFLKEYLFLCEKLNTNMQEKMLLDSNSPYNILKNAFEKAPEPIQTGIDLGVIKPKKYLTWEDLKESNSEERLKVKLNNVEYELHFEKWAKYDDATRISLFLNEFCVMSIRLRTDYDKQFFNDLHLEVEE